MDQQLAEKIDRTLCHVNSGR